MREAIKSFAGTLTALAGIAALASCGNSSPTQLPAAGANQYVQIERLARPAVKELFQSYAAHDSTNRANPYSDPTLPAAINGFMTTVAKRSQKTADTVQAVLIPDEIAADLSQPVQTSSYLGYETGGATGSKFGGRGPLDNVIDVSLGVVFGNTLSTLPSLGVPDDKAESPCLTTENVPATVAGGNAQYTSYAQIGAAKNQSNTFPYLGTPY
jgi:predicted small lipoprotein YifL